MAHLTLLSLVAVAFTHVTALPQPVPATLTLSVPPFFNPISTALPAVVLGVDSQGRTTYAVEQDQVEASTTIPITGTLVQGADHASYTFSFTKSGETVIAGFDCGLQGGNAICSDIDTRSNSQVETATISGLVPFVIDVVSTAAPSGSTASSGSAAPSGSPNSARGISASVSGALVGVALAAYGLFRF
ncbi:hypothetical protein C8R47DRAFT_1214994 [Mycena vitilis]|nr:hypothetical protein C8R47DRAFT_1214994 [Mycena vitilis]